MNGRRISLAVFCLFLNATAAFAQDNPPASRIAGNIQNLGSARFQIRQQAAYELTAMGEPALKWLRAALTSKDVEIRHRAQLIIQIIEARLQNDLRIQAPKLRLKYDNKPLDEAVADVAKKTGLAFVLDDKLAKNPKQPVTLDTGEVPYWEAVERFLATTGLVEFVEPPPPPAKKQEDEIVQYRRPQSTPAKPIRLIASKSPASAATQSIVRVKALAADFPGSGLIKGSNEIKLFLDVTPAPSLAWQGNVSVEIRKAIDDRGFNLAQSHLNNGLDLIGNALSSDDVQFQAIVQARAVQIGGGGQVVFSDGSFRSNLRNNSRQAPVTFLGRDQHSKMLKELEGVITAQVLTAPETLLTIENLQNASAKEAQNGEYKIQITERQMDKGGYLQLRFQLQMPVTNDMNNLAPVGGAAVVVGSRGEPVLLFKDSNGKTIQNLSLNVLEESTDGNIQCLDYLAVVPTRGSAKNSVKFELSGRKLVNVDIPFKLKNVPLP